VTDAAFESAVDALLAAAAQWSGFQPESLAREAVRRCLAHELATGVALSDVIRRMRESEPGLVQLVRETIGVRETYLFRHPEHFELVASRVAGLAAGGVIRAWSAGCATGEEAWSLAATIVAASGGRVDPSQQIVLGTDIHAPALSHARTGLYRASAQRPSAPLLYPAVTTIAGKLTVEPKLRSIVSFDLHDLRDPPPGDFEVIFCRNVLIYFTRDAARAVLARLASALAPGGLLVFGAIDVDAADLPQLVRVSKPELNAFTTRPTARARKRPATLDVVSSTVIRQVAPAPVLSAAPEQARALHRTALLSIETGGRGSAEKALVELTRAYPDYVPGILERALGHVRKGDAQGATHWMNEVMKRIASLPDDHVIAGLEDLPVAFYRETARTYLEREP
jgi:chemotaxis methyl-accepting protein methylase